MALCSLMADGTKEPHKHFEACGWTSLWLPRFSRQERGGEGWTTMAFSSNGGCQSWDSPHDTEKWTCISVLLLNRRSDSRVTCRVTGVPSIFTILERKSVPIVARYMLVKRWFTYLFMKEDLPTLSKHTHTHSQVSMTLHRLDFQEMYAKFKQILTTNLDFNLTLKHVFNLIND